MRQKLPVALLYLVAVVVLAPSAVSFDGMSFLRSAREGWLDLGHALYTPLLVTARALAPRVLEDATVARCVSGLGAALAFVLLWRRVERAGLAPASAGLVALAFSGSLLVWQEAGSVEPTTWTVALLLLARSAAERHARAPGVAAFLVVLLLTLAALGLHLVSVCALPWLAQGVRPESGRWPRAVGWLAVGLVVLGVGVLALRSAEVARAVGYWRGFVPDLEDGLPRAFPQQLLRGARLLAGGASALTLGALLALLGAPRRFLGAALWLGLPYGTAFVLFGRPLVGLLVPLLLAATLGLAALLASTRSSAPTRALAALVLAQLAWSTREAVRAWRAPDTPRLQAELYVRHLPENTVPFAGALANHLRFYHPELTLVSLPEEWSRARAADPLADPLELVRRLQRAAGRPCALTSDAVAYLHQRGAQVERLGLSPGASQRIPEDPHLALFLLD